MSAIYRQTNFQTRKPTCLCIKKQQHYFLLKVSTFPEFPGLSFIKKANTESEKFLFNTKQSYVARGWGLRPYKPPKGYCTVQHPVFVLSLRDPWVVSLFQSNPAKCKRLCHDTALITSNQHKQLTVSRYVLRDTAYNIHTSCLTDLNSPNNLAILGPQVA